MDTSETNIKMCEKSEEIQELSPKIPEENSPLIGKYLHRDEGSIFWIPEKKEFGMLKWDNDEGLYLIGGTYGWTMEIWPPPEADSSKRRHYKLVWLPRQDELQNILSREKQASIVWTIPSYQAFIAGETTWEQLWLAFVMKEKWGKIWNGEDWVEDESQA
jgi:hypothetical protein